MEGDDKAKTFEQGIDASSAQSRGYFSDISLIRFEAGALSRYSDRFGSHLFDEFPDPEGIVPSELGRIR